MDKYFTNLGDKTILFFQEHLLNIVIIIAVCYILRQIAYKLINAYVRSKIKPGFKHSKGDLTKRRQTVASMMHSIVRVVSDILVVVLVLSEVNISLAPFLASAGIAGAIIGFGVQSFIKDLVSGSFVIAENQYRVGDWVTLAGVSGTVQDVGLRITTLTDADDKTYYIPHSSVDIVTNHSKNPVVLHIKLSLSYKTDLEKAKKLINSAGDKLAKDPELSSFILEKPKFTLISDFGPAGIEVSVKGKVKTGYALEVSSKLRELINEGLSADGIEMAAPMMTVSANTTNSSQKAAKSKK
jgi:small-conductance mechanosensitive channel